MDNPNPSQHNPARRGSLSLSQTFSLDWTASPPPADLEQIHASSSQTPGLTSFSLGSPPATQHEPLIFNRIFSRVKGFADAVRDAVGGPNITPSSSPTRSLFSGPFGGDRYNKQSASRDSFQSLGNGSDDAASLTSIKSPLSSKSHPRQQSVTSMQSGVSRVSGPGSIAGPEYAQPSALRKVNQMAATPRPTTNASVDQVTVFRGRIGETSLDNMASVDISRTQSLTSIREGTSNVPIDGKSNSAVGAFIGAVGNVVGPTTGFGSAVSGNSHMIARPFIEADDDFDDSASDGTLSDSSDDDLVMLHSRLPAGPGGRPRQEMPKNLINGPPERKARTRSSASAAAAKDKSDSKERVLLPPPATSDSFAAPDPNMLTPSAMTPAVHIISPQMSGQSGQNPGLSALSLPSSSGADSRSSSRSPDLRKDIIRKNKPLNDQSLLLPGYKISGDRISEADSTTPGPSQAANEHKGEATSSVYKQDGFGDGKMVNGTHSGGITGSTEAVSQALRQLRMGNLTRDFWMKDEVCKDCFLCGTTFTAWRRKHHCRLCGQIFCAKCTTLISGDKFGHQGSMRVCSPCLNIVNDYQDYSDSDDTSPDIIHRRPSMTGSKSTQNAAGESSLTGFKMPNNLRPGQTPLMAIPATRTTPNNNPNRRSQILEINADIPSPPRPTSSRSIKAGPRPATSNSSTKGLLGTSIIHTPHHKHTRSHHRLSGAPFTEERAPFHRNNADERRKKMLPAFHADNILDPDLAPYMSDEEMTDGEQMSVFATIAPKATDVSIVPNNLDDFEVGTPVVPKGERAPVNNGSMRRRNRSKSRGSINGLGALLGDGGSSAAGSDKGPKRASRRRGSSFIGPLQQRPATRAGKSRGLMRSLAESVGGQSNLPVPGNSSTASPRASRSAPMRGPFAPNIELNTASLEHVKRLLRQLLTDADIPNVKQWENALIPILLKSTDDLNPDLRNGDSIDIRHYVKVKRIPGAKPGDTSYVSGVVFTKNLALKSMPRNIAQPRIVVVTFPIEYSRHQQQLMSLEPVIAQEKEFLTNMINRIAALRPTLLLVQKNVSGLALSMLATHKIATAYLVKPSVIEAVSRCAEADIFSSVDKLALSTFKLGRSSSFDVKTFVHPEIPGRKKTFMFLSGCQKELGCTIVLRGASMEVLARIKQITELMVYVVYNLKLETCLMRDEFVVIPSSPNPPTPAATKNENTPPVMAAKSITPGEPTKKVENKNTAQVVEEKEKQDDDIAIEKAEENGEKPTDTPPTDMEATSPPSAALAETPAAPAAPIGPTATQIVPLSDDALPDDLPNPTYYEDMVRKHETKLLSASPFVSYMQPYLLTRARELERKLAYLRRLRDELVVPEDEDEDSDQDVEVVDPSDPEKTMTVTKPKPRENFVLVDPLAVHGESNLNMTRKASEVLRAIYDAEYDKALHVYETQKRQWENYLSQYDDLFDPFAHQSIAILYSMVCTVTTIPCEGPEIRRLEFYGQDHEWTIGKSDCTLGQYIEYLCDTANHNCDSTSCDRPMLNHHRSYVHGQARVSVLVSNEISCPIQGMQNTILMWSYCKVKECGTNTPAIPMSESSWKYSFGKYLELAFWSSEMKMRTGNCPHDINRDHVRCFGYHGLTVMFQFDTIELLEIVVPRTRITYKPEIDLRVKNEQYTQNEGRIKAFFSSVKKRLKGINMGSVSPEKIDSCHTEIETLMNRAQEDEDWLIAKLQEKYNKSKYYEIIPLNRALRALQEKVVEWDSKFSGFDANYFPSEKDIRRLAALQLKKIFLDNTPSPSLQSDENLTPMHEKGEGSKPISIDGTSTPGTSALNSPVAFSADQAHDVLASVVEEEKERDKGKSSTMSSLGQYDDSGLHNMGDIASSQELVAPDDVTPKQEPSEADLSTMKSSQELPTGAGALSVTKEPSKSTPALMESDRLSESETSTGGSSAPRRASLDRPRFQGGSAIPRLDNSRRRPPPGFSRTVSVPTVPTRRDMNGPPSAGLNLRSPTMPGKKLTQGPPPVGKTTEKLRQEKKLDKFRLNSLAQKPADKTPKTQIPRSVPGMQFGPKRPIRESPKVSSLAKHFEQLSKEFERERAKERKELAAKRVRALPVATSRPIVEIYRNAREAVEEGSDEEEDINPRMTGSRETKKSTGSLRSISPVISRSRSPAEFGSNEAGPSAKDTRPEETTTGDQMNQHSDADADASDDAMSLASDHETLGSTTLSGVLPPASEVDADSSQLDTKLNLPQHRTAWMKMLTNFWAERSASGWTSLEYPLHPTDHVFNDSDIIVREDEPSSLIAFTLNCEDYIEKLDDIRNSDYSHLGGHGRPQSSEEHLHRHSFNLQEHPELERSLLKTTGTHLKYQFQEGTAKMFCKVFYAEQFDALRRNCGIADRYVESLSRCIKWDSRGGKTRSVFLKTQDERIVLKSLSPVETSAFIKFAPAYFQFMAEAFFHELPTVIAKMLGFYQIMIKNPSTGTEIKWDILVMENLFYDRKTSRIFDLKGSMRNRYMQSTGEQNEVLLDENMVEFIYESPLFVREHSKKLLRASLWNDTLFLSRQNVMDYSLMIGIDEDRKELCVGIIDCIRTFTWDKMLESWVKEKGLAGGGRKQPTVTSPREYKHRFREAMERYVLEAPSCWHLFRMNYMGAIPLQLNSARQQSGNTVHQQRGRDMTQAQEEAVRTAMESNEQLGQVEEN